MKKVIEHLKKYWGYWLAYLLLSFCIAWNIYTQQWDILIWVVGYFIVFTCLFVAQHELIDTYMMLEASYEKLERVSTSYIREQLENVRLREENHECVKDLHERYSKLEKKYIQLRKKYEPEALAKEIEAKPKRRPRKWQKKDTPMSK